MKYYITALLVMILLVPISVNAAHIEENGNTYTPVSRPVISEIQTGSQDGASEEFIEIYNPTNERIDLSGWKVEYSSSSGDNWHMKSVFNHSIEPRGYFLLSTYLDKAGHEHNAGLSASGGHIRLIAPLKDDFMQNISDKEEIKITDDWLEIDRLGWGDAMTSEVNPAPGHPSGSSISRVFNEHGHIVDTNNNGDDFRIFSSPTPTNTPLLCMEVDCGEDDGDSSDSTDDGNGGSDEVNTDDDSDTDKKKESDTGEDSENNFYHTVVITEILPDPEMPQTDAKDEFVELFNPHEKPIDLSEYRINTGADLNYQYEIDDITIRPNEYKVFYSRGGTMTLTNSGGRVQIINPSGGIASNLAVYPEVLTGETWAKINGKFIWTDNITPGNSNKSPTPDTPERSDSESTNNTANSDDEAPLRVSYPDLHITELFPDPDNPLTDADDEFVELYNPTSSAVNLEGYILETGTDFGSSHELSGIIEPGAYKVVFADNASISLVNSGGAARLVGEDGSKIFTTDDYPKAEIGAVWAMFENGWQWSEQPTPSAPNQLEAIANDEDNTSGNVAGAEYEKSAQDNAVDNITKPATIKTSPYTTATVVISIVLALLYAVYEFRHDIRNRIELTRRYIARWRASRE